VVAPTRSKRDGAQLDILGYYRPGAKPVEARIDLAKAREWIKKGAIASPTMQRIIKLAEKQAAEGGDPKSIKIIFGAAKTKKTHKERLAAKKKKD
jgi:small subunit ribosomal protein S16